MKISLRKLRATLTAGLGTARLTGNSASATEDSVKSRHPFLTPAGDFEDVSRGNPKPQSLRGEALSRARLTAETWRLDITADDSARIGKAITLDLPALTALAETHGAKFIKAMQCLNIPTPLGQGLWEGVLLRDVLRLCGKITNVRRIYI
ncbi:MAG: hypothetical protein QNL33_14345 [Akkermansiaceae bacterium]|jgi:hypothetical protein